MHKSVRFNEVYHGPGSRFTCPVKRSKRESFTIYQFTLTKRRHLCEVRA